MTFAAPLTPPLPFQNIYWLLLLKPTQPTHSSPLSLVVGRQVFQALTLSFDLYLHVKQNSGRMQDSCASSNFQPGCVVIWGSVFSRTTFCCEY